ncbi:amidase signature domain-containing protein [Lasiosphaeria hispida]|uniref:Amidase signature domain-containing protein n=1 Tax=Lasiosphaeria hispida TaxID=260671 RepID=A0AAJ0H6Y2_9PEZI|nr:amidase signature domain-containing protein [Lasiosphaeria hispida]
MAPTPPPPARRFANHPGIKEASAYALTYAPEEDKNPPLRGLPLVIASTIIGNAQWLQKLLWSNAKFGQPRLTPGLDSELWRMQPNVIPLPSTTTTTTTEPMLPLTPDLQLPQPAGLPGRFASVADYHELYKSGEATPLQVVEALLPLITRPAASPSSSSSSQYALAFIQTDVEAVLVAARASTARWAAQEPLGVLDGVPFGVKDDTAVKGFVSTMGMRVDVGEEYFRTPEAETVWPVEKLLEAGAVMMGKMNQDEVGMGTSGCNPSTGTAVNWYNTSYYTGGSSAGAGSALSGGLIPIAVGTDAGGSMRIPPAFCGQYGLKPTHNRTTTVNSSMCVIGPMASTVADLTIAYRYMSQPNPSDPGQNLFAMSVPPEPSAKKYLGICPEWVARADPEVRSIFDEVITHLTSTKVGYELVEVQLPFLREGQLAHAPTCLAESADAAKGRVADERDWLKLVNYGNRVQLAVGAQTPAVDYLKYGQIRQVIMQHLAFLYEEYPGLLIVTPTTPQAGIPVHPGDAKYGVNDGNTTIRSMMYVWFANTSGCPAVTCPAGYAVPKQGEGDLPVGVMAMGEWGAEEQLLVFAGDAERYLNETYPGGRKRPEEWVDVIGIAKVRTVSGNADAEIDEAASEATRTETGAEEGTGEGKY